MTVRFAAALSGLRIDVGRHGSFAEPLITEARRRSHCATLASTHLQA